MKTVEIIFSPTGGTEKVARIFTSRWELDTVTIDLSDAKADFSQRVIEKEDRVLIAMPSLLCRRAPCRCHPYLPLWCSLRFQSLR